MMALGMGESELVSLVRESIVVGVDWNVRGWNEG